MLYRITSLVASTMVAAPVLLLSPALVARAQEPIAPPGKLVAVNLQKDKCYDKKPDGTVVEVKCPDVIVAKPKPSSSGTRLTPQMIARKARAREFVPRSQINQIGVQVSLSGGTYNCYNENPPGHFTPVRCPDIIVLETDK